MKIENTFRGLLNRVGFDVRRLRSGSRRLRTTLGESYSLLRERGFRPKTVIDVGVASGTMQLYTAFPDSYFLLVEPLKEFEPDMKSILKQYEGSYVLAAAGAISGQVTFNVHQDHLMGSSLYKESMGVDADGYERTVQLIRIDDIVANKQLSDPYLVKVDVQGAELDVLDGARQTLKETEVVVLEVSMFEFMKDAPQFSDVISYMYERGFVAYDIVLGWNRPLDNALGQVDIVFVKERGMFRHDHSYSTLEEMKAIFGS